MSTRTSTEAMQPSAAALSCAALTRPAGALAYVGGQASRLAPATRPEIASTVPAQPFGLVLNGSAADLSQHINGWKPEPPGSRP